MATFVSFLGDRGQLFIIFMAFNTPPGPLSLSAKKLLTGRWQARPLLGRKRMSGEKCIGRAKDLIIPTCTPPFAPSFLFSIFSFYTNDTAFVPLQSHARKATWCSSFLSFKFLAKEEFPC